MSSENKSLREIFLTKSGKVADKWESYINVYEEEFSKYRDTTNSILEMGVQNCGSLEIWSKYFYKSQMIIGNDILDELHQIKFEDKRINLKICDSKKLSLNFKNEFKSPVIIIDDASHQSIDIINNFISMFPLLLSGGVYVIEDLCCSYWEEFNKKTKVSSMFFLKSLADLINYEHWSKQSKIEKLLKDIGANEIQPILEIINSIKAIKFYNSLCFIYKTDELNNLGIGQRIVVGDRHFLEFIAKNGQRIDELQPEKREFEFDDKDLKSKFYRIRFNTKKFLKKIKKKIMNS